MPAKIVEKLLELTEDELIEVFEDLQEDFIYDDLLETLLTKLNEK